MTHSNTVPLCITGEWQWLFQSFSKPLLSSWQHNCRLDSDFHQYIQKYLYRKVKDVGTMLGNIAVSFGQLDLRRLRSAGDNAHPCQTQSCQACLPELSDLLTILLHFNFHISASECTDSGLHPLTLQPGSRDCILVFNMESKSTIVSCDAVARKGPWSAVPVIYTWYIKGSSLRAPRWTLTWIWSCRGRNSALLQAQQSASSTM